MCKMLGECLDRVRQRAPLVHNITNYVTANDVANLLLACGARPIMADDPQEAAEITAHAAALHLNLGTFSSRTVPSMLSAGEEAGRLGRPIVLDPVGVGASPHRRRTAKALLEALPVTVIRGTSRSSGRSATAFPPPTAWTPRSQTRWTPSTRRKPRSG